IKVVEKASRFLSVMVSEKQVMDLLRPNWHPFVVYMFNCFQTKGHILFVMEYLEGRTLNVILAIEKFFTEQRTVFYSSCVLLAIGYLHSLNIAHRDIKLENIALDRQGYPKLIDFGMAEINVKHNTPILEKSGTRFYQGPEFLIPGMITRRSSDFWSLGVII
ncbi:hypothetical protein HELRODRAFT_152146, partial [Helobdella robusta]|uniref:Protein kinase domain-containing protein n=1 Tax=Helobdella robusta TaxID=6412 RepID=T1EKP7_HELRO